MGADSRRKGASFERSVVSQINEWLEAQDINFSCKRNLDHTMQSSANITRMVGPTSQNGSNKCVNQQVKRSLF